MLFSRTENRYCMWICKKKNLGLVSDCQLLLQDHKTQMIRNFNFYWETISKTRGLLVEVTAKVLVCPLRLEELTK